MASPSQYSSDTCDAEMEEEVYATPPEGWAEDDGDPDESGPENDSPELRRDRNANDQRLRGRFEHIFAKYSRDFTDVGDQIDIETGEIVIDNGHLRNMLHEADPGQGSRSLQLLEHEDDSASDDGDVSDDGDDDELESDSSDSDVDELANGYDQDIAQDTESGPEDESDHDSSVLEASVNVDLSNVDPELRKLIHATSNTALPKPLATPAEQDWHVRDSQDPDRTLSSNVISLPALQESLQELSHATGLGRDIDSNAIEKLGKDIADQLARYVGQKNKNRTKRKSKVSRGDSSWDYPELPAFKRRRLADPQPRPQLVQLSDILSPPKGRRGPRESIWAPVHHPKQPGVRTRRKDKAVIGNRTALYTDTAVSGEGLSGAENTPDQTAAIRECAHCLIKVTTAWRLGPDRENLCNACGMYWYRYDLMRPLLPPTPDPLSEDEAVEDDVVRGDPYPANTSRTVSYPGFRSGAFTTEEDALIIKLKEIDCLPWERIGRFFPGRSHYGVQCRYSKRLNNQSSEGRSALVEQGFTFEEPPEADISDIFTEEQGDLLVQLREDHEFTWGRIAEHFPGKTDESVEFHYNTLIGIVALPAKPRKRRAALKAPGNHQRPYTKEEDELIIKLREIDKLPWELLAQEFPQRTWLALQKRYVRTLAHRHQAMRDGEDDPYTYLFLECHPEDEVRLGPAGRNSMGGLLRQRREEDLALMRMKDEEGLTFEEIAEALPGRTVESLNNRYEHLTEVKNMMNVPVPTSTQDEDHEINIHEALEDDDQAAEDNVCIIDPALTGGTGSERTSRTAEQDPDAHGEVSKINSDTEHPTITGSPSGMTTAVTPPSSHQARSMAIRKYTKSEHARIAELRNVNLDWKTIAAELPDRTPASIASYWAQYCKHKATWSSPLSGKKKRGSKQSRALLRQAMDNGMRRIPNGGKRAIELPSVVVDGHPGPMNLFTSLLRNAHEKEDGHNEVDEEVDLDFANVSTDQVRSSPKEPAQDKEISDEEVDFDFAKLGQGPLDRISASTTPVKDSMMSANAFQAQMASSPDMIRNSGLVDYGVGTSTLLSSPVKPLSHASDVRPSISRALHSNIEPAAALLPIIHGLPTHTPVHGELSRRPTLSEIPELLNPPPSAVEAQQTTEEWRPRDPTRYVKQPGRTFHLSATTPARASTSRPPATPVEAATPFKTPLPASSPFMAAPAPAMYSTPARYSQQKMPYFNMPRSTLMAASPAQVEELLDMPDDMVEDDMTVVSSEDDSKPVIRTVAPTSFAYPNLTARSLSPPGATIKDRLVSIPSTAGRSAEAPPFSWTDLITMALKSSQSQHLEVREMQAYLKDKFPYFKSRGEGWKRTLRAHLATSSEFQKMPGRRDIWTFRTKEAVMTLKDRTSNSNEPQTTVNVELTAPEGGMASEPALLAGTAHDAAEQPGTDRSTSSSAAIDPRLMAADDDTTATASNTPDIATPALEHESARMPNSQLAAVTDTWIPDLLMAQREISLRRKPGRPPKNGIISQADQRALGPRRPPGRPPGARNKPKGPQGITEYALPSSFLENNQEIAAPQYEVPSTSGDILQRQLMGPKITRPKSRKDPKTVGDTAPPIEAHASIISDVNREPESSPARDHGIAQVAEAERAVAQQQDSSAVHEKAPNQTSVNNSATRSSSPSFMQRIERTPVLGYSRAGTPAQADSAIVENAKQKTLATTQSTTPAKINTRAATSAKSVPTASEKAEQRPLAGKKSARTPPAKPASSVVEKLKQRDLVVARPVTPAISLSTASEKPKPRPSAGRRSGTPAKAASSVVEKLKQRSLVGERSATPALAGGRGLRSESVKVKADSSARQSMQKVGGLDGSEDELA
ncbi:hypothetical protein LTR78_008877 [Recurvomyces mirabilis]|uniref:Uncharacterized protein n=1 Tax=Recurvomyces mirabilis TaxID=574656 RepID=A0AAE0WFK3_9PEZI|nr:hypothetical protein LTR78_008877 [Recurvomyces mirabilis]KAK5155792.1 hypothetical protein LTS14_005358 [Recurvomyces mirabilis]